MRLVRQWNEIEQALSPNWADAQLELTVEREADAEHAAALLGSANPLRRGTSIHLFTSRSGGLGPEAFSRALSRLDRAKIAGRLELETTVETPTVTEAALSSIAAEWDEALKTLPDDWSDLYGEIELTSTDHIDGAALLASPLNPLRDGTRAALRFRAARRFGYGAAPGMVRRCFERIDAEGIPAELRILRVLADTKPVGTQGPVWQVGGRTV